MQAPTHAHHQATKAQKYSKTRKVRCTQLVRDVRLQITRTPFRETGNQSEGATKGEDIDLLRMAIYQFDNLSPALVTVTASLLGFIVLLTGI